MKFLVLAGLVLALCQGSFRAEPIPSTPGKVEAPETASLVQPITTPPPPMADRVVVGKASTYGEGYNGWLALPEGPGHRVKICYGRSQRCATRVSNDAGPDLTMQRAGRVADLDIPTFEYLCQCSWRSVGLIPVRVIYLGTSGGGRPNATPPPTSTGG